MIVVGAPVQLGFVGGEAAKVSPATGQSIKQAVALMEKGGKPESNIGEGRVPEEGCSLINVRVVGSIAYCQGSVVSNSRSVARAC